MSMIRFAVVDDQPLFVEGVVRTLEAQAGFEVVAKGSTAVDAVRIARETLPDLLLLEVTVPGSGLIALREITAAEFGVKVLMLTVSTNQEHVTAALQCGARGYLLKSITGPELVRAVRSVHEGDSYVSPSLAAQLLSMNGARERKDRVHEPFHDLSFREGQVLSFMRDGMSNKEIGSRLKLSEKTIKHHVTSLLQKLQVKNRVQAALLASKHAAASARDHAGEGHSA
jgi:two-component system nitrate/nitrite response regulator NarL